MSEAPFENLMLFAILVLNQIKLLDTVWKKIGFGTGNVANDMLELLV